VRAVRPERRGEGEAFFEEKKQGSREKYPAPLQFFYPVILNSPLPSPESAPSCFWYGSGKTRTCDLIQIRKKDHLSL